MANPSLLAWNFLLSVILGTAQAASFCNGTVHQSSTYPYANVSTVPTSTQPPFIYHSVSPYALRGLPLNASSVPLNFPRVPQCALTCLETVMVQDGCDIKDAHCHCQKLGGADRFVKECVKPKCSAEQIAYYNYQITGFCHVWDVTLANAPLPSTLPSPATPGIGLPTAASNVSSGVPKMPECALSCFSQVALQVFCSIQDSKCQCERAAYYDAFLSPCVRPVCSFAEYNAIRVLLISQCDALGMSVFSPLNITRLPKSALTAQPTKLPLPSYYPAVPLCAARCYYEAVSRDGCELNDAKCHCGSAKTLDRYIEFCIVSDCKEHYLLRQQYVSAVNEQCAALGVPVDLPRVIAPLPSATYGDLPREVAESSCGRPKLPSCAVRCYGEAVIQIGCHITDTRCQCSKLDYQFTYLGSCFAQSCSGSDVNLAFQGMVDSCIGITLPPKAIVPKYTAVASRTAFTAKPTVGYLTGLLVRQNPQPIDFSVFPNCTLGCVGSAVTSNGCDLQDGSCHCGKYESVKDKVGPCVLMQCTSADAQAFGAAISKFCSANGVSIPSSLLALPSSVPYVPFTRSTIPASNIASAIVTGLAPIYNTTGNATRTVSSTLTRSNSTTTTRTSSSISSTSATTSSSGITTMTLSASVSSSSSRAEAACQYTAFARLLVPAAVGMLGAQLVL